jgi:hypothetical protein
MEGIFIIQRFKNCVTFLFVIERYFTKLHSPFRCHGKFESGMKIVSCMTNKKMFGVETVFFCRDPCGAAC